MVTKMQMLGPGMYTQSTVPCEHCNGTGEIIDPDDVCPECNGKKVIKERKVLEVNIDKGAPHGEKYLFHGESDEYPGREAGDVIIVVNEQPHKLFKRKGADLLIEKEISLLEALTGVDFVVDHLDGSKFRVKSVPGQVIKPDTLMTIEDKGLPFHKNPYQFGNLFVLFKVQFPESITQAQVAQCETAFQKPKSRRADEDMPEETVELKPFHESQKNTHAQGGTTGDDDEEEDEDPRGGQRVQCAQ